MEQEFELKSFKLDVLGAECKYVLTETDDEGVTTEQEHNVKIARPVHNDLIRQFVNLGDIVREIFGIHEMDVLAGAITFAGKGDNIGLGIAGNISTKMGAAKFKIPRIKYLTGESEVCAKLTVFADAVVNEVYAYLFENKSAKMEVFGEAEG